MVRIKSSTIKIFTTNRIQDFDLQFEEFKRRVCNIDLSSSNIFINITNNHITNINNSDLIIGDKSNVVGSNLIVRNDEDAGSNPAAPSTVFDNFNDF